MSPRRAAPPPGHKPSRHVSPTAGRAPRALDAERAGAVEAFAAAVLAHHEAAGLLHRAVAARVGVSVEDLTTLTLIARRGPLTAGEVGAATGLASASVTGLLDRLEARGFVRRTRDAADGRRVRAEPHPDGFRRIGEALAALGLDLTELAEPYSVAQLALVTDVLERVAGRVRAVGDVASPPPPGAAPGARARSAE